MPNLDGGHYFLTTLAPIRVGTAPLEPDAEPGATPVSYAARLQRALSDLPTAWQSPATSPNIDPAKREHDHLKKSPFTRSLRTHLCRFVVINDAVYNGRISANPLVASIDTSQQPLVPQHIDELPCAYVMFAADFDAVLRPGDKLPDSLSEEQQNAVRDDYLEDLWRHSSAEMLSIYENCQDFDRDKIKTPADFAAYMRRCQIETWMSFNDYYLTMPDVPQLPVKAYLGAVGLPLLAFVIFALAWLTGFGYGVFALLALAATAVALYIIYQNILANGKQPWPAGKFGSLPDVLKGLYTQQKVSDFVVAQQGASAEDLHKAFGKFIDEHKPDDVMAPTQPPGVIASTERYLNP